MTKKIPVTRFPDAATVTYSRTLRKMIGELGVETIALFEKYMEPELSIRQDNQEFSNDGLFDSLKKMLRSLKSKANKVFAPGKNERAAQTFINSVNRFNRHNLEQQMRVRGIDLTSTETWVPSFLKSKIKDNVGYIETIEADYFRDIEEIVNEGVVKGSSIKLIRQQLMERVEVTQNRAQFIAIDQVGSILGQMTAQRHQNIGVEKFKWLTSADERVRETHKALNKKVFSYSDPPEVNGRSVIPGEDYRCRCVAIPIFDDE
ncbi:minor capsid protein [Psychrobacillus sp. Sa2BUA9]|uniref:Minor capsid protein n=1 Tax=Psychrobacillus faecigallinarum TaxID=2762235 RepID=A0ABR8RB25_9BACI|nr:minor capsid protein [Psychrobacillus faecigallinarum]MBD7944722.1 minor capsid protein [Psychrobacillus faecigallinarum]